ALIELVLSVADPNVKVDVDVNVGETKDTAKSPSAWIASIANLTSADDESCDCDHFNWGGFGGCVISKLPPANKACRCYYRGLIPGCGGNVGNCIDSTSNYCKTPCFSIGSCLQGGGDCLGYKCLGGSGDKYCPTSCTSGRCPDQFAP
ncbi:unnamed protein product, partial [Meganyctiphanes norvegica]